MTVFSIRPTHTGGVTAMLGSSAATSMLTGFFSTGSPSNDLDLYFDAIGDTFNNQTEFFDLIEGGVGNDVILSSVMSTNGSLDILRGGLGNDYIEGGYGRDDMDGGDGVDTVGFIHSIAAVYINLAANSAGGANNTSDAFDDRIHGFENVQGSAFDDILTGDDGNNVLTGEGGNDILTGGLGSNELYGGQGDDIFVLGAGADHLFDTGGTDTVRFTTASTINFEDGFGLGDPSNDIWDESFIERFEGSSGNDAIILTIAASGNKNILGMGGNDILGGNAGNDLMDGGSGIDYLYGRDGFDQLSGGTGNDFLYGDADFDILKGGYGNDTLDGGSGFDRADFSDHFGNSSLGWTFNMATGRATTDDFLGGFLFRTEIDRLVSIEAIIGSNGNDVIYDNGKNNVIDGNGGQDTLYLAARALNGAGFLLPADDVVDMALGVANGPLGQTVEFSGIEILYTGIGNDTVNGTTSGDEIRGESGRDTLNGGGGSDALYGGSGGDTLSGGEGSDLLFGGLNADILDGGEGLDFANYFDENYGDLVINLARSQDNTGAAQGDRYISIEGVIGGNGSDVITGDKEDNNLAGGRGDDVLNGGLGFDLLAGEQGGDTFVFSVMASAAHMDDILDFEHGIDVIQLALSRYGAIGAALTDDEFVLGTAAMDANDFIIFDEVSGNLYYDADGNGGAAQRQFAHLQSGAVLTASDFEML